MKKNEQPIQTKHHEIQGNGVIRQIRHWVRMKTSIMGNYDTGPGLKNLIILWVLHRIAKPIFFVHTWFKNQHQLKHRMKRLIGKA